jgi:hypothetical protein
MEMSIEEKENCNLQREIFDTKIKMIIANAKYNENKRELDKLKNELRLNSCEVLDLVSLKLFLRISSGSVVLVSFSAIARK